MIRDNSAKRPTDSNLSQPRLAMPPNALAIIPARGGSKRIPHKNIRAFHGRPIISYPIAIAQESACFSEVMVSTDDDKIAQVARDCGASVPFMRSAENSHDTAQIQDVVAEVVTEYAKRGRHFSLVCCIYPTAALITTNHLLQGLEKLQACEQLCCVLPVVRFDSPIQRALVIRNDRIPMLQPEHYDTRSQDLEPAYHDVGQWYWLRYERFAVNREMLGFNCSAIVLSEFEAQDVDDEDDWRMAELKYSHFRHRD
jgi:pseudaminic acid cytidylyltransferase